MFLPTLNSEEAIFIARFEACMVDENIQIRRQGKKTLLQSPSDSNVGVVIGNEYADLHATASCSRPRYTCGLGNCKQTTCQRAKGRLNVEQ